MKFKLVIINVLLIFILLPAHLSFGWECDVTLDAPMSIKVGQQKTLSASGTPVGGSYSWSSISNLVPAGATATLTGFEPTYSEYLRVTATYTSPRGKRCSDSKYIWVCMCEAKISGPTTMFLGETVSLSATAYPEDGGTYTWNGPADLTAGMPSNTAVFTPAAAGEAQITVDYTAPDGTTCTSAIHRITVKEECKVTISGPQAVALGATISLQGEATPAGGYFTWGQTPGLIPWASSAILAGETAGTSTVQLKYTASGGDKCTADAHNIDVYKVSAISGPNCVNSGDRVPKEDYTIATIPGGYEDKVIVSPEVLSILLG
jgi:hypothetical protein